MLSEVDVFISNYTLVDPEVYQLWVDGHSCKINYLVTVTSVCRSSIVIDE